MRTILLISLLLVASAGFSQASNKPEQKKPFKFIELNHGLGALKEPKQSKNRDSSVWGKNPYKPFKVVISTDSVPAKLNYVFGVEFKVAGKDTPDLAYTQEWIYPTPMKEDDGRKYRSAKINAAMSTNTANTCNYTFNESYELLKGNWKLNIYVENELMYSHTFIVY